jgi:hypothetical protein
MMSGARLVRRSSVAQPHGDVDHQGVAVARVVWRHRIRRFRDPAADDRLIIFACPAVVWNTSGEIRSRSTMR